ncbi:hypothetical protein BJF93_04730 [Xaviernesmea oryzae]|uniref:Glycosyl transferase family 1 domain-containing protein n=1 Tax=Xaviernesmea oryzae TaxID=464029 RepID=A0A1Q9AUZ2_9HYPH|nr:glycosyltransferase family 1 protein [Xaviernesmea oryzae]OLP59208.1 hypothetical protein BJF93_04730 [Xaviernesmea oryzae]SEK81776.1 Glycosyl transferases group 1 [Xaviernesmea oryzae]
MYRLFLDPLTIRTPRVLFDISRLYRNRGRRFGTGVDRIDLAIGLDLMARFGDACHFVHAGMHGIVLLPQALGRQILTELDRAWRGDETALPGRGARLSSSALPFLRRALPLDRQIIDEQTTYVVASHSGVAKLKGGMRRLDPQARMARAVYVHDLIPIEYPEYQRPETAPAFTRYLGALADAPLDFISNSNDTDRRLQAFAAKRGWPVRAFHVNIPRLEFTKVEHVRPRPAVAAFLEDRRPFFTILGTIEPRKNHLLLLNIWREMAMQGDAPRLLVLGKRGWENENIVDMLERCDYLKDHVVEFDGLTDGEVQTLLTASAALLFPSFCEGLGIPLLEAAALGVPAVVADLEVFREIAPPGTTFLSPLDGLGWMQEIRARIADDRPAPKSM